MMLGRGIDAIGNAIGRGAMDGSCMLENGNKPVGREGNNPFDGYMLGTDGSVCDADEIAIG